MTQGENWNSIKDEFNFNEVLEAKNILNHLNSFKENKRKSRFMMGFCSHSLTDKADDSIPTDPTDIKKVVNGVTKTATAFLTVGINFVLPTNIFWNKVFCIMVTPKSFVVI